MKKKKKICSVSGCIDAPYLGGLCEKHYKEHSQRTHSRDVAKQSLHTGTVEGRPPDEPSLRKELSKLCKWWDLACRVVQSRRDAEFMPLDEAEYAIEWCISLAQEIIDAELALRHGRMVSDSLATTQHWVWNKFKNLESGYRSNGLPRNDSK